MVRIVKILLAVAVALWGYIGAFHNLVDWQGTLGAVTAATSMSTFEGGPDSWQATSSPLVVWCGALFIMLSKLAAAALCSWGAVLMWRARRGNIMEFQRAKDLALAGCGVAVLMLFLGFIVVAESWFELWRSEVMRGPVLGSAFRYAGMIGLIALLVAAKDAPLRPLD